MHQKWSTIKHNKKVDQVYRILVAHTTESLIDVADEIVTFFEEDALAKKKAREELEDAIVREKAITVPQ